MLLKKNNDIQQEILCAGIIFQAIALFNLENLHLIATYETHTQAEEFILNP